MSGITSTAYRLITVLARSTEKQTSRLHSTGKRFWEKERKGERRQGKVSDCNDAGLTVGDGEWGRRWIGQEESQTPASHADGESLS